MNKCSKKVAWRFRLLIVLQVIVPLSLRNKASLALAVHDDTKKLSASQVPMYREAIEAVCRNSVRFRSDVWRETRYLTGRFICVDTHLCWSPERISTCSCVATRVASKSEFLEFRMRQDLDCNKQENGSPVIFLES